VGAGVLTAWVLSPRTDHVTAAHVAAVVLGTLVFFSVNMGWLAVLLAALGHRSVRATLLEGGDICATVAGTAAVVGLVAALAASAYPWFVPAVFVPVVVLRWILAGHFHARHDRARLQGLFDATLRVHDGINGADVRNAIRSASMELLRCGRAEIEDHPPAPDEMGVPLGAGGPARWLTIGGRKASEPMDAADTAMLEALAAVGAGALAKAELYAEVIEQRERLAAITASLGEGVCALDREGAVTFLNPAGRTMLRWGDDGDTTTPVKMTRAALRCMRTASTVRSDDSVFERADRSTVAVAFTCSPVITDGLVTGAVLAFSDITERKAFEDQLAHHAFHDALTGLANRRLFLDHLDQALRRSERRAEMHAVLFFDVDRFKLVNDSLGHQEGDALLKVVARRLQLVTRAGDTLARFGGDEFVLLIENVADVSEAIQVAQRVQAQFVEPVILADSREVFATASIGVALSGGGRSRDDLLHDADVAMYKAKARSPGEIEVFDPDAMAARSAERLEIETALRRGIDSGEIEIYYQPVFSLDGAITGAEALVRWNHPTRGLLGPSEFIPIAEETGLVLPLGRVVLEEACRQARRWHERGRDLLMSVNLSARQFQHAGLATDIRSIVDATGLCPERLCLEITESLAMADTGRTIAILHALEQLGVQLAIDDFGTGYSSLGYLKHFPVDVVKIDRSFVAGLGVHEVDDAITTAVITLAHAVRMTTVAEGVETQAQLDRLAQLGCDRLQGFYLGRPMPATALTALLDAGAPAPAVAAALVPAS
jgi:diguanylate cyclase (GGDEF)-like protein